MMNSSSSGLVSFHMAIRIHFLLIVVYLLISKTSSLYLLRTRPLLGLHNKVDFHIDVHSSSGGPWQKHPAYSGMSICGDPGANNGGVARGECCCCCHGATPISLPGTPGSNRRPRNPLGDRLVPPAVLRHLSCLPTLPHTRLIPSIERCTLFITDASFSSTPVDLTSSYFLSILLWD